MFHIVNFFSFQNIEDVKAVENALYKIAQDTEITGLLILAGEGVNGGISSEDRSRVELAFGRICESLPLAPFQERWTQSAVKPFGNFKVKQRPEIVTLGTPELRPDPELKNRLTPAQWHQKLVEGKTSGRAPVLVDTRNWYEFEIGSFDGAINPNIDQFTEFPDFVARQKWSKDQEILIFCTGGIRCEKAVLQMNRQGFEKVFQLDGGILHYLEEFPNAEFKGDCFVFDQRVSVNQQLEPSGKYHFCPHCGQPAHQIVNCSRCGSEARVCDRCLQLETLKETCSKNCAHHYRLRPGVHGRQQAPAWKQTQMLSTEGS